MKDIKNEIQNQYLISMSRELLEKEIENQKEIDQFWDKIVNNLGMTKEEWENL